MRGGSPPWRCALGVEIETGGDGGKDGGAELRGGCCIRSLSPSEMSPSSAATSSREHTLGESAELPAPPGVCPCEDAVGGSTELPAPSVRPLDTAVVVSPVSSAIHCRILVTQKVHWRIHCRILVIWSLLQLAAAALSADGNCRGLQR